MATAPKSVTIRSYQVGFGDCFLLSFQYGNGKEKHVLVDFGSTALPKGAPKTRMMDIAKDIAARSAGELAAVVATHRHKDHISGFETKENGKGTGDVIKSLHPKIVVQPWTEDPDLQETATGPKLKKDREKPLKHVGALSFMQEVAAGVLAEAKRFRFIDDDVKEHLSFLGEDNVKNLSAVKNLMSMAPNHYVFSGKKSGLEKVLPGVTIDVLGPPTVDQTDTVKTQRQDDPDEFWLYQANAMAGREGTGKDRPVLFPDHVRSHGPNFPLEARWLIFHARKLRGEQLLQIVTMLDDAMNNTSVILLFRVGDKTLLFPGDAQIENWLFALGQEKYLPLLEKVDLYKVGHHGSRNATPKSLWKLFKRRSTNAGAPRRLIALMSTMEGKHGHAEKSTEVPRTTLVKELGKEANFFTTQTLTGAEFFHDTTVNF